MISGKGQKDENVAFDLTTACINAMQDKIAGVRSSSEQFLTALMARGIVTRSMLEKATRDLPPAAKRSLQASIDRMNSAFGTKKSNGSDVSLIPSNASVPAAATGGSTSMTEPTMKATTRNDPPSPKRPSTTSSLSATATSTSTAPSGASTVYDGYAFKKTNKAKRYEEFNKV